uniref:Uncharacterized protein n=1 Tax=Desulfobacca acetoxidans TaxID=60893 RepID=A0A7V4G820_9BACT
MSTTVDVSTLLLALLGVMASVAGVLFWRLLARMEEKVDQWWREHTECRQRQMELFVRRDEFQEWKDGRRDLWERLNRHQHAPNGSVVIKE